MRAVAHQHARSTLLLLANGVHKSSPKLNNSAFWRKYVLCIDVQSIHSCLHGVWFPSLLTIMLLLFHELGGPFTHVANPSFAAPHA